MKLSNDIGTVINVVPNVDIDRNKKKITLLVFYRVTTNVGRPNLGV